MKVAEMSEGEKAELDAMIKAKLKELFNGWMNRVKEQEGKK
jgi:hypothetical protein